MIPPTTNLSYGPQSPGEVPCWKHYSGHLRRPKMHKDEDSLGRVSSLLVLSLAENEIGSDGTDKLRQALAMNVQLTVLDVSINHLGVSGAKLLANGLANNVGITCLNAGFNFLGNEDALTGPALQLHLLNLCLQSSTFLLVTSQIFHLFDEDLSLGLESNMQPALRRINTWVAMPTDSLPTLNSSSCAVFSVFKTCTVSPSICDEIKYYNEIIAS